MVHVQAELLPPLPSTGLPVSVCLLCPVCSPLPPSVHEDTGWHGSAAPTRATLPPWRADKSRNPLRQAGAQHVSPFVCDNHTPLTDQCVSNLCIAVVYMWSSQKANKVRSRLPSSFRDNAAVCSMHTPDHDVLEFAAEAHGSQHNCPGHVLLQTLIKHQNRLVSV